VGFSYCQYNLTPCNKVCQDLFTEISVSSDSPIMNSLPISKARENLKAVMDDVCKNHAPMVVTRESGEHVVLMSLSDFNSAEETMYLFSSAKNANRLMESVAQLRVGQVQSQAPVIAANTSD